MILSTRARLAAVVLAATLTCGVVAGPALAAPPSLHAATSTAAVAVGERLAAGSTLKAGEELVSAPGPYGQYRFAMQSDGNAVVYSERGDALWVSGTSGAGNSLTLQRDGNIVIYSPQGAALWSSGSDGRGEPSFLAIQNDGNLVSYAANGAPLWSRTTEDTLLAGRQLDRGRALVSVDGRYRAAYQADGNLVVYAPWGVSWSAGTSGGTRLVLQVGDLASLDSRGAYWFTGTGGSYGERLVMQTDGNLVLYSSDGHAVWSTQQFPAAPSYRSALAARSQLTPGQSLTSRDEFLRAVMQSDGNFVVYEREYPGNPQRVLWSAGTSGAGNRLVMQDDGNAVVYSAGGRALWSTATGGNPGAVLVLQNDANLVVYSASDRALWNRQGSGYLPPYDLD